MGEAKRRKAVLGDVYGTPEGSNGKAEVELGFRYMTTEEVDSADFRLPPDYSYSFLVCSFCGFEFPVAVRCVRDAVGQFNSYVYGKIDLRQIPGLPFQGTRKNRDHRSLNRFLLETSDVILVRESDQEKAYTRST